MQWRCTVVFRRSEAGVPRRNQEVWCYSLGIPEGVPQGPRVGMVMWLVITHCHHLVGDLEHVLFFSLSLSIYILGMIWNNNPNLLSYIFRRGGSTTQSSIIHQVFLADRFGWKRLFDQAGVLSGHQATILGQHWRHEDLHGRVPPRVSPFQVFFGHIMW